eukprot:g2162.t1
MSSLDELVAAHTEQGNKVKAAKEAGDKAVVGAEVAKLMEIKKQITALAPDHAMAIKEKKKKDKKKKDEKPGEKKLTKKELRMLERQKKQKEEEAKKAEAAKGNADVYGDTPVIQSQKLTDRVWTRIDTLEPSMAGRKIWLRGSMHKSRVQGKGCFFVLRQAVSTVQATLFQSDAVPKEMVKYGGTITKESIVQLEATVKEAPAPITATTQKLVELEVHKLFNISKAAPELPFQLDDAAQPYVDEEDMEAKQPETTGDGAAGAAGGDGGDGGEAGPIQVGLSTLLDHRTIDLRVPANQGIIRIRSGVMQLFREFLHKRGFCEVSTPKILGGSSEGGSECFGLDYFGQEACLAQSPQLYKQMTAACSGLEKVFEIGPVFRAEKSLTRRHLCEFTGLDMEMAIEEHYFEVLHVFGQLFNFIFEQINERYAKELEAVQQQYPFEPLQFLNPPLRITWKEGIALLRADGVTKEEQGDLDDLSTPVERRLGRIVKEKYGTDFFMMDKYPKNFRPFYTMPCPDDPDLSNSYDFFIRGQEILSGAQRIHDEALLRKRLAECHAQGTGPEPASLEWYVNSFAHGALPHGGGGIGLERVVMLMLDLPNIRKCSIFPRDPKRLSP